MNTTVRNEWTVLLFGSHLQPLLCFAPEGLEVEVHLVMVVVRTFYILLQLDYAIDKRGGVVPIRVRYSNERPLLALFPEHSHAARRLYVEIPTLLRCSRSSRLKRQ